MGVGAGFIALYESGGCCFFGVHGAWGLLSIHDLVQVVTAEDGEELGQKLLGWKSRMKNESGVHVAENDVVAGGGNLSTVGEFGSRLPSLWGV